MYLVGLESLPEALQLLVGPAQQFLLLSYPQPDSLQMLAPSRPLILSQISHVSQMPRHDCMSVCMLSHPAAAIFLECDPPCAVLVIPALTCITFS